MTTRFLEQEGYDLMGAAFEVYNEKGNGYLEDVYQECLELELRLRGIPFQSQPDIDLRYKDHPLEKKYRPDLIVSEDVVVELKAVKRLGENEFAQLLNYLKSTGKKVGYLINFGSENDLEWKRFIL